MSTTVKGDDGLWSETAALASATFTARASEYSMRRLCLLHTCTATDACSSAFQDGGKLASRVRNGAHLARGSPLVKLVKT